MVVGGFSKCRACPRGLPHKDSRDQVLFLSLKQSSDGLTLEGGEVARMQPWWEYNCTSSLE